MRKLDEWIKKLCPDGVAYKKLGGVVSVCRGVRVVRAELQPAGKYPVYQNSLTPMGYHDKGNCIAGTAFIIGAGAAGDIGYSDVPFWAADDCFYFVCEENMNARFLYHVLSGQETFIRGKVRKASVPRLPRNAIENMIVPLPPPDIQHEIVRTLDNFTELTAEITAELTAELTARKQQYEYYRDSLLSFERARIEWRPLSTIADIGTGSSNTNEGLDEGLYPFFVRSQEPRRKNEYEYDETAIITAGDGVGVGKVFHYVEGKYALHQRAYRIHITAPDVLPRYYFHYMRSAFLPYIEKTMYQGSVASIRRPMLNSFPVPIPSMAVQEHIVNVLDNFEDICSDLNIGLPAEIEARKQQYEFYRDLLLTFVETGNTILTDRQTDRQT